MLSKVVAIIVVVGPMAALGIAMIRLVTDPYVHRYPYKKPEKPDIVPFDRDEFISRIQQEQSK